jgi:hypothetical protein
LAFALTTLSALKDWLGVSGTAEDTRLTRCLSAAELQIASVCNRPDGFLSASHVQKFETADANAVVLTYTPVASVTSASIVFAASGSQSISSSYYRLDDNGGILRVYGDPSLSWSGGWPATSTSPVVPYRPAPLTTTQAYPYLKVTYVGGYGTSPVPPDLAQTAIDVASMIYKSRGVDPNMKSETLGNYSYTVAGPYEVAAYIRAACGEHMRPGKGYFG